MRLIAFKLTFSGPFEPFGCATMAFHFWHLFSLHFIIKEPSMNKKTRQGKMRGPTEFF